MSVTIDSHPPRVVYPLNAVYYKRLLTWADFLDNLHHRKFSLELWANECGTVACAAGWLPTIFPRHWKTGEPNSYPRLRKPPYTSASFEAHLWYFFHVLRALLCSLVYPSYYAENPPRKKVVVERIRKVATDLRQHGGCKPISLPGWRPNLYGPGDEMIYIGPKGSPLGWWEGWPEEGGQI